MVANIFLKYFTYLIVVNINHVSLCNKSKKHERIIKSYQPVRRKTSKRHNYNDRVLIVNEAYRAS